MNLIVNDFWNGIYETARKFEQRYAAICCEENQILMKVTYHDVLQISKALEEELLHLNVLSGMCFGLLMEHNPYIPAILMSLWKVKSAFMFLDVHNPEVDKLAYKLNIKYILSVNKVEEKFCVNNTTHLTSVKINETHVLHLASLNENKDCQSFKNINFIIQTSGTTGHRKLVKVQHECIISNVNCLRKVFKLNESDVIYFGTNLTFDPSIIELYLAMSTGACLLIPSQKARRNWSTLFRTLSFNRPSFLQMCPTSFLRWSESEIQRILLHSCLRILVFGGEAFPVSILRLPRSNTLYIYNIYGVTEVSCWASIYQVKGSENEIPLGLPLDDTVLEVRNEAGDEIKNGVGELFIGTHKRICQVDDEPQHIFKELFFRTTGDKVLIKNDHLYYLCRTDDVIKRFGCRVDLLYIETITFNETGFESKCLWLEDRSKLVLFVKISETDVPMRQKILDKLRVKLLHCLMKEAFPDQFEALTMFPVTKNGKIDKTALKNMALLQSQTKNIDVVQVFISLWSKYFSLDQTELTAYKNCSFHDLGGNSVLSVQFSAEFKEITRGNYSSDFFDYVFLNSYEEVCKFLAANNSSNINNNKRKFEEADDGIDSIKEEKDMKLEVKWKYNLHACVDSTATIVGKNSIAIGAFSHIFAIVNLENGSEILKVVLPDAIENESCVSPCNKFVYVGCNDGRMYCIDMSNGQIMWRYSTGNKIKNKPCLTSQGNSIVFGSYDKFIHCIKIQDGSLVWKTYLGESITSNPIYIENLGHIFVATIQGSCHCINEIKGHVVWTSKFNCPVFGSPCILKNSVVWPDVQGIIHGISCGTGNELWKFQAEGYVYSSLTAHEKFIIFGCHNKNIYYLEPSKCGAKVIFKVMLDSVISAGCSVLKFNNNEFVVTSTTEGILYLINIKTACIASKILLNGQIFSTPIVVQNKILVGCRDNNLYCVIVKNNEINDNNKTIIDNGGRAN